MTADDNTLGAPRRLPWRRLVWVAVLVGVDLLTKSFMFGWLERGPGDAPPPGVEVWELNGHWRYEVWGDFLGFMLSENKGAAWGVGEDVPWLLVGGRVVAAIVLTVMVLRTDRRQRMLLWSLVLVLSGALGNLYDNLTRTPPEGHPFGAVRDFIHVYFARWDYHYPTFNVADSCILVGAVLLVLSSFLAPSTEAEQEPAREPAHGTGSEASTATGPTATGSDSLPGADGSERA